MSRCFRRRHHIHLTVGATDLKTFIKNQLRSGWLIIFAVIVIGALLVAFAFATNAEANSEEILLPAYGSPAASTQKPAPAPAAEAIDSSPVSGATGNANNAGTTPSKEYDYRTDPAFDIFPDRAEYDPTIVNALQKRLTEYGYYTPVTGRFDEDTGMSVKKFQLDYGLACDGVVGDATYDMLNFNTERWTFSSMWYTADLKHVAYVIPCEFIYYVNCGDDPHLTVYHKTDQGWKRTLQVACVVGASTEYGNITPLGYHEIWSCQDTAFEHGGLWYYAPVFYTVTATPGDDSSTYESEFGIHSFGYDANEKTWYDWVVNRDYYPTGKLTNGCVRVDYNTALWLQQHATVGTPVVVDDRDFADVNR
ncbi:murein L,D-transpeptidase [Candidatus Saccharibacteria bacterium]|nr:murein L,D-transpeptidase [Candidatus Saccharibacteria bacterium]